MAVADCVSAEYHATPQGGVGDCDSLAVETSRLRSQISSVPAI